MIQKLGIVLGFGAQALGLTSETRKIFNYEALITAGRRTLPLRIAKNLLRTSLFTAVHITTFD